MRRYFYIGLLGVVVIGVAEALFYRTHLLTQTQPTAEFSSVSLRIEYATTSEAKEQGLAGRTKIQENYGMLFVFPKDGRHGFWMKGMLVPIDIFWLDSKGQVVYIASDVATSTYPNVFYSTEPARYVLETVAGFARKHNIATGTLLMLKNLPTVSQ